MARVRCTAPYCSSGMTSMGPCLVCKGKGWVEEAERVVNPRPGQCPYNACGGECRGAGYYYYRGARIDCSLKAN
jgi:hypothetical protein